METGVFFSAWYWHLSEQNPSKRALDGNRHSGHFSSLTLSGGLGEKFNGWHVPQPMCVVPALGHFFSSLSPSRLIACWNRSPTSAITPSLACDGQEHSCALSQIIPHLCRFRLRGHSLFSDECLFNMFTSFFIALAKTIFFVLGAHVFWVFGAEFTMTATEGEKFVIGYFWFFFFHSSHFSMIKLAIDFLAFTALTFNFWCLSSGSCTFLYFFIW